MQQNQAVQKSKQGGQASKGNIQGESVEEQRKVFFKVNPIL